MYAEERQQVIALLAQERGRVGVADLARRFSVTPETVRRDLEVLSAAGTVDRVHGGAVPAGRLRLMEAAVPLREASHSLEKGNIARAAVKLLPGREDATILIDGGTTTARLGALLTPAMVGTVITNSIGIAGALAGRHIEAVHLVGGRVRGLTQTTVGAPAVDSLRRLRVDVAFIGTNGFSVRHGFSTPDPSEAAVKSAMVRCGQTVVALADSSKVNNDYLVRFAELTDVDVLVTDSNLPQSDRKALSDEGIEVVLA